MVNMSSQLSNAKRKQLVWKKPTRVKLFGDAAQRRTVVSGHVFITWGSIQQKERNNCTVPCITQYKYHEILIFLTSKGNGNWFEKSGIQKIEGGIESHLFYYIWYCLQCMRNKQAEDRVVKRSQLQAKIATYLVSIAKLLCLAFLYRWCFLNKISLDWPLTLATQPSTSKLSDNTVRITTV